MPSNIQKWVDTIKICMIKHTAYRANFILQIIAPIAVFYLVKYSLWSTLYQERELIGSWTRQSMMDYHFFTFVVTLLATGHQAFDLSHDIRLGKISTYLIYPFNFWEFHTASFIAYLIIRFFIVSFAILIAVQLGWIANVTMLNLTGALIYCVIISFFWFLLQFTTGLITFWMEETWILRVIITVISSFLSGYYYPLDLYPEIMQTILKFTPFPYLSYYPSKLFMHFSQEIFTQGLMVLALWALPLILINRSLWRRGLKQYSGAGI